jgi:hypothetical protein
MSGAAGKAAIREAASHKNRESEESFHETLRVGAPRIEPRTVESVKAGPKQTEQKRPGKSDTPVGSLAKRDELKYHETWNLPSRKSARESRSA